MSDSQDFPTSGSFARVGRCVALAALGWARGEPDFDAASRLAAIAPERIQNVQWFFHMFPLRFCTDFAILLLLRSSVA